MASTFSLPSKSVYTFSSPQLERSGVETSEKISTTSAAGTLPRITWKLSSANNAEDLVSNVGDTKTLVATNDEESMKDETNQAEKRKQTFLTFSTSLGREKTEADLLAMCGSKPSKESTKKKRRTSVQNSLQDDLSSFSSDNSSDTMGCAFNFAVETSESKSTSSDGRSKIIWKFSTAASKDNKNEDKVTTNAVDQTLVSTESEEPEKVETWKNKKKVSNAVNQTLIAKNGNAAESVQTESNQLGFGIVPLTKENGEKKKRTFSTFSISLTRDKIEADLIAMGGSKRTRGIKKRPKNVQRQLDDLFPGLLLK